MALTSRNGIHLNYEDVGTGVPVLFLTGGGGDLRMWKGAGYVDAFGGCRLLLLDHRGHGKSDQPNGLDAHRPDEYVEDVVAVLDDARVASAALVGYSGGAATLFRLATAHPSRAAAVVALGNVPSPAASDEARGALAADVRRRGMRALMEGFSHEESEPAPQWLIENLSTTTDEMFALPLEASIGTPSLWDVVANIECPVLLICGGDESDDSELDAARGRIPHASVRSLPGFGHLQAFWHAEVTAPIIVDWLKEIGKTS